MTMCERKKLRVDSWSVVLNPRGAYADFEARPFTLLRFCFCRCGAGIGQGCAKRENRPCAPRRGLSSQGESRTVE